MNASVAESFQAGYGFIFLKYLFAGVDIVPRLSTGDYLLMMFKLYAQLAPASAIIYIFILWPSFQVLKYMRLLQFLWH